MNDSRAQLLDLESLDYYATRWLANRANNEDNKSANLTVGQRWQREVVARAERKLETPAIIVRCVRGEARREGRERWFGTSWDDNST